MTQTRVYAFTDDAGQLAFAANDEAFGPFQLISVGLLHAITGPEPSLWPWENSAFHSAQRLLNYHRTLGESVKHLTKVIPASFESVFEDAEGVRQALHVHQRDILGLMKRYGHLRQFSLSLRWDVTVMQQLMERFPKAAASSSLENERRMLRDQILLQLQGHLRDLIILEDHDKEVILQAVVLVEAKEEERIAGILQRIDAECQGRLTIRLVGPLPACNFARVEVMLPDQTLVRRARQDLGIKLAEPLSRVKDAYRQRVKALHPDSGAPKQNHELMVRLTRSYRYLSQLAAQQNPREQNDPDKQWLRCDRRTLRQTPLMYIQRGITRWDDALIKRA